VRPASLTICEQVTGSLVPGSTGPLIHLALLIKIAKVLDLPIEYFFCQEPIATLQPMAFRKKMSLKQKELKKIIEETRD